MNSAAAKKVPITAILGDPVRADEREAWYRSPFREERTPSFKVDLQKNLWFDHGEGKGGNIIDLVCRLKNCSVSEALQIIEAAAGGSPSFSFSPAPSLPRRERVEPEILKVKPIENKALIDYLNSRKIGTETAREYCREIYYSVGKRRFFGIAFENDGGGWEIRNKYAKVNIGGKAVTTIRVAGGDTVSVFEGFFDFLAAVEKFGKPKNDVVVLNSLALLAQGLEVIERYRKVLLFLDNDQAGKEAARRIQRAKAAVTDYSGLYFNYKDLAEWIAAKK